MRCRPIIPEEYFPVLKIQIPQGLILEDSGHRHSYYDAREVETPQKPAVQDRGFLGLF